jgi:putative inorganic carbon (HCO3(-)) transporter
MRDFVVISLVLFGSVAALRRPWIGVLVWTWLSIMNPHRFTWGWAYDAPLAATAAGATLLGMLTTSERESPLKGAPAMAFLLLVVWITLSWMFGLDPKGDYEQWIKVMKIDFMIFVALALLHRKEHIMALAWVTTLSLALLGAKGGFFTLMTGGAYRVWGPVGSFIEDNNEFALALVMTIPLLRFLQNQLQHRAGRHGMTVLMLFCAIAAVGSYSRGALVALISMSLLLWWRGRNRFFGGIAIVLIGISLVAFMPDVWNVRMSSIGDYEEDRSALGRISAWWNAWNLAFHYPFGAGFDAARPALFAIYSPYPTFVHAAHSIYFQMLGNHGFVGLGLFLLVWITTWHSAGHLRVRGASAAETKWCAELGAMCQVSLVGYATGGAFLSLSYFDLPYVVLVMVVLTRVWMDTRAWERQPFRAPSSRWIPGLGSATKAG